MDLIDEIKVLCTKNRTNLARMTKLYNETYGTNISAQSMHRKLQTRAVKYDEVNNILKILNHDIIWQEREQK